MSRTFSDFVRVELAPPRYLSTPAAGVDISASGVKVVTFKETLHGLELADFAEEPLPAGTIVGGEIADRPALVTVLKTLASRFGVSVANITLPESRGYLFEADVSGTDPKMWRVEIERHLDEYVPLPVNEVMYDAVPLTHVGGMTRMIGVGYARRVAETSLAAFDEAGITVGSMEGEVFALPRALRPHGDLETVLIIDIGKTTTKLLIAGSRLPRFATTLDVGGHALTLAVEKHFGVSEEEAKRVKAEQGLHAGAENQEFLAAMLSTVSVIREEVARRLDYWQARASAAPFHEPVTRALLVGGNATVRGLPEYLEASLKIPVELGDVFCNLASRDAWLPPLDYTESLAYGTAIGLALRDYVH
ncbi:MAG: type pilus assembly protein PilM [Candidatus Parcubacteria bacterium]|jgi:type IV pilus assembly protein PilM|nr:type pilus assembly protein PilM [Candidatus Parcubacteria bacterium]